VYSIEPLPQDGRMAAAAAEHNQQHDSQYLFPTRALDDQIMAVQ